MVKTGDVPWWINNDNLVLQCTFVHVLPPPRSQLASCYEMCFESSKCVKMCLWPGLCLDPKPLRELTMLPRPLAGFRGRSEKWWEGRKNVKEKRWEGEKFLFNNCPYPNEKSWLHLWQCIWVDRYVESDFMQDGPSLRLEQHCLL